MACNTCGIFGYNADEGMKAMAVGEIFTACFHFITSVQIGSTYTTEFSLLYFSNKGLSGFNATLELVFDCLIVFTLFVQGILGCMLYPLGWKKKNLTVCWAWIIVGCTNLGILLMLLIITCEGYDLTKKIRVNGTESSVNCKIHVSRVPIPPLLYLLYVPYGVFVQIGYIKWAHANGVGVEYSISQIKSEHHDSKHLEQDPELHEFHEEKSQKSDK